MDKRFLIAVVIFCLGSAGILVGVALIDWKAAIIVAGIIVTVISLFFVSFGPGPQKPGER